MFVWVIVITLNRGKWFENLTMSTFFVVCFCLLFWSMTLHKTLKNTKVQCLLVLKKLTKGSAIM